MQPKRICLRLRSLSLEFLSLCSIYSSRQTQTGSQFRGASKQRADGGERSFNGLTICLDGGQTDGTTTRRVFKFISTQLDSPRLGSVSANCRQTATVFYNYIGVFFCWLDKLRRGPHQKAKTINQLFRLIFLCISWG